MAITNRTGRAGVILAVAMAAVMLMLSGCSATKQAIDDFNAAIKGRAGTMSTYNVQSQLVDQVHGVSFRFKRDNTFDTTDPNGNSNKDSSVIEISLGNSHIFHVGSTLIFAQDGITDVSGSLPSTMRFSNAQPGTPWLNDIREHYRNLWHGKAKTIMVRSQDGTPLAVYAGDSVSIFSTDIPKSTVFRVDDRYLLVYRADYTVYDTDLLNQ